MGPSSLPDNGIGGDTARRVVDIGAALVAGVVAIPLMAAIAIAVRATLGGPILFIQERAGKDGRPFRLYKFRSMTNTRDASGVLLPDADRTPAFGRFLRRTRLDELPELWNILIGDMSLVGPRPILPETVASMGAAGTQRSSVRPGLTGWAQVSGNASLTNADKLALDLWYIDHRSLRLDLRILLETLRLIARGDRIDAARVETALRSQPERSRPDPRQ